MKETVVPNRNKIFASIVQAAALSVVKDTDEDTGKAEQARKLNIPLMTPESFKKKYNL